jgi:P-type E1-E2 ATPase
VLVFAAAALLVWTVGAWAVTGHFDPARAVFAALAVLVMGYPCALGMATPLAMIRGGGMAAEKGILMRSAESFQVLKEIKTVVLDKTGTITRGEPAVVDVVALGGRAKQEVLRLAAAAESSSEHPLARAIVAAAQAENLDLPPAAEFHSVSGKGATTQVEGQRLAIGSPRFIEQEVGVPLGPAHEQLETLQKAGNTVVALAVDGRAAALIALADQVKDDAREALQQLRSEGLEPVMLTGDNGRTARAVAERVGIIEYRAELLPQDKATVVRDLQRQGRVAMVGDGINDAPALMQADVGIAIGAGTDIAIESADVVLIRERLGAVVDAYRIGKSSYAKTVQNISLAFVFNGVGVPLAVSGLVHPVWAMIAMAASVTTVLANSFGVQVAHFRPPHNLVVAGSLSVLMAGLVFGYNSLGPAQLQPGLSGMGTSGSTSPPVRGYAEGREIRFIHTEVSDTSIAQILTAMVHSPVLTVPELAQTPPAELANVYVFTNGIQDGGPLGFQLDVFDNPPGTPGYRPLRALNRVAWTNPWEAHELKSAAEVQAAQANGELRIEQPGVVINMPMLTWPGGQR